MRKITGADAVSALYLLHDIITSEIKFSELVEHRIKNAGMICAAKSSCLVLEMTSILRHANRR